MTDELALQRLQRLAEEAEQYEARLLQLAAQRKLFQLANGKDPETIEVLEVWVKTSLEAPVDPYEILTREEIAQVWEDAEDPSRQSY
ncbi:MAG: hypothetical protein ACR2QQ_08650 [Gammaproteobacteria bacterium]